MSIALSKDKSAVRPTCYYTERTCYVGKAVALGGKPMRRSSLSRLVVVMSCLVGGAISFSSPAEAQRKKPPPAGTSEPAPKKKKKAPAAAPVAEAPPADAAAAPAEDPAALAPAPAVAPAPAPAPPPPPVTTHAKRSAQPAAMEDTTTTTDLPPPPQRSLRKKTAKNTPRPAEVDEDDEVPVRKKTTAHKSTTRRDLEDEEEEDRAATKKTEEPDKGDDEPEGKEAEAEPEPESDVDTDTDSPAQKARRPKPFLLDVTAGLAVFSRHFSYADDVYNELPNYDLGAAPAISLEAAVYPFKNKSGSLSAGFVGRFEYAFGIATTYKVPTGDQDGSHSTTALAYSLGVRGNYAFGKTMANIVSAGFEFGGQSFVIDHPPPVPGNANIPSVEYKFVRPNLMGRFPVIDRLAAIGTFGYLMVSSAGEIVSPEYFRGASSSASGIDIGLGAAYEIKMSPRGTVKFLELRPMLTFRQYAFKFNPDATDPYIASGATDQYFGINLGVATRL
jgi:hypothetical protein